MKKLVFSMLSLLLLVFLIPQLSFAAAGSNIQLIMNGKQLNPEVAPRKIGDYSMVPVRIISEELGAKVSWNQAQQKVTVEKGDTYMELWIGKDTAKVNARNVMIDPEAQPGQKVAPVLIPPGTTLLPVRFVAEQLGVQVNWDDATQTVYLTKNPESPKNPPPPQPAPIVLPENPGPNTAPANPNKYAELVSMTMVNDQFVMQAAAPIAPKVFPLSGPDRLVIDIPATAFGKQITVPGPGQMGGIYSAHPNISQIRYAMNAPESSTIRIVIDLKARAGYKVIENGSSGKFVLELNNAPKFRLVLDAGHGDQDPGAKSANGRREKDFNLAMVLKVKALLDKNPLIDLYLTRSDDTFVTLDGRVAYANNLGADAFVSIHGNSFMSYSTGTETYYYRSESLSLAQILHRHIVNAAGFPDRNVRQNDFRVIKYTTMPAVLLEIGYLSNAGEEAKMFNPDFQNRVAASIAAGIKQYFNIK